MTRTGRPRSSLATHRLAACLVAAFWCAAPVLATIHADAEVHRYCAEHARVEESTQPRAERPAPARPAVASDSDRLPAHEGCAFGRVCRFGQVLARVILAPALPARAASFAAPALAAPAPSVPILSVAPKTSPPVGV